MSVSWKSCWRIGASVFLLYLAVSAFPLLAEFAGKVLGAAVPLLLGAVIANVINILMSFYERHYFPDRRHSFFEKSRRAVCMLLSFLTLGLISVLLFRLVVPELKACVELLIAQLPAVADRIYRWLGGFEYVPENILAALQGIDWKKRVEQFIGMVGSGVGNVMGTAIDVVSNVFSGAVTALLALIFSIYLLSGKETLRRQSRRLMARYMSRRVYEKTLHVLAVVDDCFHRYIVGQCLEAVILGVLCALGMLLLHIPYATMTGAVIAFTALIPVAGAYIGAAVGAFMILTVSPAKALLFLVFLVILQQLEGNLIYPRVVGSSMGLPAIWVLASVTVGGGVMGIAGMVLGVPVAAALYRLLKEDVDRTKEASAD